MKLALVLEIEYACFRNRICFLQDCLKNLIKLSEQKYYSRATNQLLFWLEKSLDQNQPSIGVLRKRCSENIHQIYRRTPMSKCDVAPLLK